MGRFKQKFDIDIDISIGHLARNPPSYPRSPAPTEHPVEIAPTLSSTLKCWTVQKTLSVLAFPGPPSPSVFFVCGF